MKAIFSTIFKSKTIVEEIDVLIEELDNVLAEFDIFTDLSMFDPIHMLLTKEKINSKKHRLVRIQKTMSCPTESKNVSFIGLKEFMKITKRESKEALKVIKKVQKDKKEFDEACIRAMKNEEDRLSTRM